MADKRKGYILLWRSIWENPILDDRFSRQAAWMYIISHASYKRQVLNVRGESFEIDRGQMFTSVRKLASIFRWNKDTVSHFLSDTEKAGMIRFSATHNGTLITIANYSKYQAFSVSHSERPDTEPDTDWDTEADTGPDTEPPHINNYKYINKDIKEDIKKKASAGRRGWGVFEE